MGRRAAAARFQGDDDGDTAVAARPRTVRRPRTTINKEAPLHLFVCPTGEVLPRWTEAFPDAIAASPGQGAVGALGAVRVVWLRLRDGAPIADQLAAVPALLRHLPLVVMSDLPDDEEALAAFAAGARGYCNTHAAPPVLQQVAAVMLQGGLWIGENLMQRLLRATAALPAPAAPVRQDWSAGLTERERQVALAIAAGASNKEIARDFGISERTVKAHVGAVLDKVGVRDRLQLSLVVHGRAPRPKA